MKQQGHFHERRFKPTLAMFKGRPDLTPLVDVFFILLLFFMLSSSFIQITGVQIRLPRVEGSYFSGGLDCHIITLAWTPAGSIIYFDNAPVTLDTLKSELAKLGISQPNSRIILYCDERNSYGEAMSIQALASRANLPVFYVTMPGNSNETTVFNE